MGFGMCWDLKITFLASASLREQDFPGPAPGWSAKQIKISLCNLIPPVSIPNLSDSTQAQSVAVALAGVDEIYSGCQVRGGFEVESAVPENFTVEGIIVRDDQVRAGHCLEQRRVGSTYAVTMQIGSRVEP